MEEIRPLTALDEALYRADVFSRDESQNVLDLGALHLQSLPLSIYHKLSHTAVLRIHRLNLAHNALTTLPDWLLNLRNLRILFLLGNPIVQVPSVISSLTSLRMLSFKHCLLSGEFPSHILPSNLIWLILTDNNLTSLHPDFGLHCRHMRKLLLANNRLAQLPGSFTQLCDLELLRLSNNLFSHVPEQLLHLPKLSWLALAGNPVCGASLTKVDQLPDASRIPFHHFHFPQDNAFLGKGASGNVLRADHAPTGAQVALKRYDNVCTSDGSAFDEIAIALYASSSTSHKLEHHMIRAMGYTIDERDNDTLWLATNLLQNSRALAYAPSFGSVTRDVYPHGNVTENIACATLLSAATALELLHDMNIVHGDVYAHNILVADHSGDSGIDNGNVYAKLSDFGAAFKPPKEYLLQFAAMDIRAFGVLCEELQKWIPESYAHIVANLARKCMLQHWQKRPSAKMALRELAPLKKFLEETM